MITRIASQILAENLSYFPITGIIGPRQVGKTTLAKSLLTQVGKPFLWLDLELESDVQKLAEAETYLRYHQDKWVVIDEIQRLPRLFPLLRALVDEHRKAGRFMILGSASPHILRESSESLAGRIAYTELCPFSLSEIEGDISMEKHWLRGGFPEALLVEKETIVWRWLDNFLSTFLERDLRLLGYEIAPQSMRKALQMLASIHGNLLNVSEISRSMGISTTTLNRYLDVLEGSFLIARLPPYFANIGKRLVKSPKFYVRDSGILHTLLGIHSYEQLLDNRILGASWEGYVIEQIRRISFEGWQFFFYRTQTGAEADLLLQSSKGNLYLIEIKFSMMANISKGFFQSAEDLMPKQKYVIVAKGELYPRADGTIVCNLSDFLKEIFPALD